MITIAEMLLPENVLFDLTAATPAAAIGQVIELLRNDPAVEDFEKLSAALIAAAPCAAETGCEFAICIPHARTAAVSGMVMSVGRAEPGILFQSCPQPIRYVFCIGLPAALDSEYLRLVGLLARVLRAPESEAELRAATTRAEFVQLLARHEATLK